MSILNVYTVSKNILDNHDNRKILFLFLYFYLIVICSLLFIVSAVVAISDSMSDKSTQLVSLTQQDQSMHKEKQLDLTQKRPVDVLTQNVKMRQRS